MKMIDTPGTAVMISHGSIRFNQSAQCFQALKAPAGSKTEHYAAGLDLAQAREEIAADLSGEWLFFTDDDSLFQPDLLMRLLARLDEYPDLDIVAALVLRRWPPHYTVAGRLNPDNTATVLSFHSGSGIARVDLTGLGGGSVIRRRALERVGKPWFTGGPFTEDWTFCSRLQKVAPRSVAVDLDCQVGHITPMSVWPAREDNGAWGVSYVPVRAGSQAFTTDLTNAAASPTPVIA